MATSVMRNCAEAVLRKEKHLAVPRIGAQGPAVREGDDRALPPVLIVDLRSIFCGDVWHESSFLRQFARRTSITVPASFTSTVTAVPSSNRFIQGCDGR